MTVNELIRMGNEDTDNTGGQRCEQEGGDLQIKKRGLRRNQPCRHMISNFQPLAL